MRAAGLAGRDVVEERATSKARSKSDRGSAGRFSEERRPAASFAPRGSLAANSRIIYHIPVNPEALRTGDGSRAGSLQAVLTRE